MNAEELKAIVEAIKALGEAGKGAFVWYLVVVYGSALIKHILWTGLLFVVALFGYKGMKYGFDKLSEDK